MFNDDQIIKEFILENEQCGYFKDRVSTTIYQEIVNCQEDYNFALLDHGYRRFGRMHFRPICKHCNACQSLRVDVDKFQFSKSHRRIFNKNKNTQIVIQRPTVTKEHLNLYEKYHRFMGQKKNWPYIEVGAKEYAKSFVLEANSYGYELLFFVDDKLVAVSLIDIINGKGISSIYSFYDHDYSHLSLGKFSILKQIFVAKQSNIPYLYMGYWIKDHLSMGYKEEYQPFEVLDTVNSVLEEEAIWKKY